jgi:ABC-2 type transport system permease protein
MVKALSPRQLFIGKLLGLGLAGFIQLSVWLISAQVLYILSGKFFGGFMAFIQLPSNFILFGAIYFVLGYLLFAVMSLGIGAISPNSRESVKYTIIYSLVGPFLPLWFASLLINLPDNAFNIILTIFPFTAPVTTILRLGISGVPAWQLIISIGVLVLSIIGLLFIAIKAFKVSLLMYGKKPSFKEIFSNISG